LLLHFSAVVSRLADETRVLAQRLALLEQRSRDGDVDERGPGRDTPREEDDDWLAAPRTPGRPRAGSKP
jgi:hypothetical protein